MEKKETGKPECKKENLISLVWPPNDCCSRLIEGLPENVTVDLMNGTWTFQNETYKIGNTISRGRSIDGYPIGVYDRTKIRDLQQMKSTIEWVKTRLDPDDGD